MILWILVGALAGAGLFIAAEAMARWWIRHRTRYRVWPAGVRLEVRQDGEIFPEVEPRVRIEINADGERGNDAGDDSGLYRILVAGGSSVECYALDQPTSWPGALERLLNDGDSLSALGAKRVHVGSIGRSGIGAPELDLVLERVLPNYEHLDAIIIMVGASTVYHWLEDGAPASRPGSVVPELLLFPHHPGQPFSWNPRGSALAELARRVRQTWLHPLEVKENVGAWLVAGRKMRAGAKELRRSVPEPTAVLEQFESHLRQALRRATTRARRVLVVRQPWFEKTYTPEESARFWHGGIGRPWKEKVSVYFSLDVINRLLSQIDARVVAVAEELGLPHLNLRPRLNPGLRHYYDHDHFTPEGAAVAAQAIAAAVTGLDESATRAASAETPVRRATEPRVPLTAR
jgi:lysophospholipase L1-like esterase